MMIKSIIRLQNDMVMVFDEKGEQVPEYQGQYEAVKKSIVKKAPPDAVFACWFEYAMEAEVISRENW
ncbi:hypothetical protein ACFLVB_03970 [Chloroflexota bacterium]